MTTTMVRSGAQARTRRRQCLLRHQRGTAGRGARIGRTVRTQRELLEAGVRSRESRRRIYDGSTLRSAASTRTKPHARRAESLCVTCGTQIAVRELSDPGEEPSSRILQSATAASPPSSPRRSIRPQDRPANWARVGCRAPRHAIASTIAASCRARVDAGGAVLRRQPGILSPPARAILRGTRAHGKEITSAESSTRHHRQHFSACPSIALSNVSSRQSSAPV